MAKEEFIQQVCGHCTHKDEDPYSEFWCSRAGKYCSQVDENSDECYFEVQL